MRMSAQYIWNHGSASGTDAICYRVLTIGRSPSTSLVISHTGEVLIMY